MPASSSSMPTGGCTCGCVLAAGVAPPLHAVSVCARGSMRASTATMPRTSMMSADEKLQSIRRVVIRDIREIQRVHYYVLDIYTHKDEETDSRPLPSKPTLPRLSLPYESEEERPAYRVIKRFRQFEALRKALQATVGAAKRHDCAYCQAFDTFLACSSMQPGRWVKWTKNTQKRAVVLEQCINQLVSLCVRNQPDDASPHACSAQQLVPTIVEEFLCSRAEKKLRDSHVAR